MTDFLKTFNLTWQDVLARCGQILLNLLFLFIAQRLVRGFFRRMTKKSAGMGHDTGYLKILRYAATGIIYFICVSSIISQIPGMDKMASSLLAGSGILAVIIGIASQEAAGSIISGALLLLFKPFQVGDTIRYVANNTTGVVEEIGLRHTVIRTMENKRLIIPNSIINSNMIENASRGGQAVTFCLEVSVSPGADIPRAMELMAGVITAHPRFIDSRTAEEKDAGAPAAAVRLRALTGAAVTLESWVKAEDTDRSGQMKSDLLLALKQAYEKADIPLV